VSRLATALTQSVNEAIRVARAEGDKSCLQQCISLSHRLTAEMNATAYGLCETTKIRQVPIASNRLATPETPMDELWAIKAALDLVRQLRAKD
jgi:anaphase-promoting complex subunit 5